MGILPYNHYVNVKNVSYFSNNFDYYKHLRIFFFFYNILYTFFPKIIVMILNLLI